MHSYLALYQRVRWNFNLQLLDYQHFIFIPSVLVRDSFGIPSVLVRYWFGIGSGLLPDSFGFVLNCSELFWN